MKTVQATAEVNFDAPPVPAAVTVDAPPLATVGLAAPAPATPEATILSIIERAARDPAVDIDKMERLFSMKLDMEQRAAKAAYLAALAGMQPELPVITKRGVISKNEKDDRGQRTGRQEAMTKYAKWEDVLEGITPVLAKHGFSLSFRIAQPTPDRVAVSGVLGHRDGHSEETTLALPIDSSGAKNNVQGWGSSVSYGKRYTAFALLNISASDEDDDGNAGGGAADFPAGPKNSSANGRRMAAEEPDLIDHSREKGTLPASKKPEPPAEPDRISKAKANAKEWTTGQVVNMNEGEPSIADLRKIEADNRQRIDWMQDHLPEQFDRFYGAFNNALQRALGRGEKETA